MQHDESTFTESPDAPAEHEASSQPDAVTTGSDDKPDADARTSVGPSPVRDRTKLVGLGAIGALVALGVGLFALSPRQQAPSVALTSADLGVDGGKEPEPSIAIAMKAPAPEPPRPPAPWRVASLKGDPAIEVAEGTFGKQGFVQSLTQAGVARAEIKKIVRAFDGLKRVEHPAPTDTFIVARDKAKGTLVAFELASSPADVWQTRLEEGEGGRFVTRKLDLFVDHKRIATALVLSSDLAKAIATAGLRTEIVDAVDDALEGHVEGGSLRAGARMRIAATEDWVEGTFVRMRVDAIELVPKNGTPTRVYYYERDGSVVGSARRAPAAGFYDAKGRQPYHGAFRSPLSLARITSRFNPKRMHPVLHTVMPHNGVDYGASTGTPVYASAAGTVLQAGNGGPCGNMVEIGHAGGLSTVYCHLNAFAQGLRSGQKVEARQLVGYVGKTGRVTGPHLHFGVKRGGVFIDPQSLKMDGVRVLPPADREAFARRRAELDSVIDGVALPSAADVPDEPEDKDEVQEE